MSATTYWDFVDNLHSITVAEVRKRIKWPPQSVNTEDLPLQFVHLPQGPDDEWPMTFDGGGGWPSFQAQLVVLIAPVVADTQERNYDDAVRMMDNVATGLRNAECGLAKTAPRWSIRLEERAVAETMFWAVVADVRTEG